MAGPRTTPWFAPAPPPHLVCDVSAVMDGWMVGWLDGWMVGWMDGQSSLLLFIRTSSPSLHRRHPMPPSSLVLYALSSLLPHTIDTHPLSLIQTLLFCISELALKSCSSTKLSSLTVTGRNKNELCAAHPSVVSERRRKQETKILIQV